MMVTFLLVIFIAVARDDLAYGAEPGAGWQLEWDRTMEVAKKEGEVVLYASDDYERLFAEFRKKYPEISVKGFYARGQDVVQRMMNERRAGKYIADLYIDGMTTGYNVLYKGKAVDAIKPTLILPEVRDQSKWWRGKHHYIDPEGQYLLIFDGESRVDICYNSTQLDPNEIKSYWDLVNPKWKGKMATMDPTIGGPVGTTLRFMYYSPLLGQNFLRRLLGEMDLTPSRDSRQIADWLSSGKFAVTLLSSASRMDLGKAKAQGLPVGWYGPKELKEGAAITAASGGIALINRAPHPNAAKIAINWLLSREGQIAYQKFFATAEEGPDSLRIDIPKNGVPVGSRRVEGVIDDSKYPVTDRVEWMDFTPIRKFIDEVWKKK